MKRLTKFLVGLLTITVFFMAGCSNSSGGDDGGSATLDLRIKKDGVEYVSSRSVTTGYDDGSIFTGEDVTTQPHVTVENVSGGLKFTITRPADWCYQIANGGGWGYVAIYREEKINGTEFETTCAVVDSFGNLEEDTFTCLYPLCEPDERYVFKVQIEPKDVNTYRDYQYYEWLAITAEDGIGDIDYTNIDNGRHLNLSFNKENEMVTVELKNTIPPDNAEDVKTSVDFFLTNDGKVDWEIINYTAFWCTYSGDDIETKIDMDATAYSKTGLPAGSNFAEQFLNTYRNSLYAQCYFKFTVPESEGFKEWRTSAIDSNVLVITE